MVSRPKILILDDEQDFLDVCQQLLSGLSSQPDVLTANSGARAITLLESEPFSLLVTDLRMPNMDGFQVLAIVRRRFPSLRIVVMTGAMDEQFRARAYAMGIDLYVEKPKSQKETQLFFECIESLLEREIQQTGFRGVQQKALVDLLQMECLTQSSALLKISSGPSVGQIWLQGGEIVDAMTGALTAEAAFREIMSWKVGSFELQAADPQRPRTIYATAQGLLLDTAQALDEANALPVESEAAESLPKLARLGRTRGVEYLVAREQNGAIDQWCCEDAEAVASFAQGLLKEFSVIGTALRAGAPVQIEGCGPQQHLGIAVTPEQTTLVAGFNRALSPGQVHHALKQVVTQWAS